MHLSLCVLSFSTFQTPSIWAEVKHSLTLFFQLKFCHILGIFRLRFYEFSGFSFYHVLFHFLLLLQFDFKVNNTFPCNHYHENGSNALATFSQYEVAVSKQAHHEWYLTVYLNFAVMNAACFMHSSLHLSSPFLFIVFFFRYNFTVLWMLWAC